MSADIACCEYETEINNGCKECLLVMCTLTAAQPETYSADGIDLSFQAVAR